LVHLAERELRTIRGGMVSMIFQEPMTSLNPLLTCGAQIAEAVQQHTHLARSEAWDRAVGMLEQVSIPDAHRRAREYPHQLSGGMRQRVMIAMAISTDPVLLIADEPTTSLDVTIQAQILELLRGLRNSHRMAMVLITHDLGVVAEMADHVVVMYAGKAVERGDVYTIFGHPHHPYTSGLLNSVPQLNQTVTRLTAITGVVPSPYAVRSGCPFKDRCPQRMVICDTPPPMRQVEVGHLSRCWLNPVGSTPEPGANAAMNEAEMAAEMLTVEPR